MNEDFYQSPPALKNTYQENRWLGAYLRAHLPADIFPAVAADLDRLGSACACEYEALARRAEREKPQHVPFDAWGRRRDEIRVSSAWAELQKISAKERLIALGYRREQREFSRLVQFAKLYLFHPSSAFFTCPLAMADGAAKVLELYGREEIHKDVFRHLTSDKPEDFWTSGQWMTEKTGGSDVSETGTSARPVGDGTFRLSGLKWFSSATTSEVALALGRIEGAPAGSRGLSLFLVPVYLAPGKLNGIEVLRLKDKLGTQALPTAELRLVDTKAYLVGESGHGVKTVASMLNITRLYNSICAVGQATRGLDLLRDYSGKRKAFGGLLREHVLHQRMMAREELKTLVGFLLTMEMVKLLGREEQGQASEAERDLLRLFTPIAKMFTAKNSLETAAEVVEGFGGAGYVEDTGIPLQLRDAQVFSIWEGATHVLSLDLLRVLQKGSAALNFPKTIQDRLAKLPTGAETDRLKAEWPKLLGELQDWMQREAFEQAGQAREMAWALAWNFAGLLVLEWAAKERESNRAVLRQAFRQLAPHLGVQPLLCANYFKESAGFLTDQLEA